MSSYPPPPPPYADPRAQARAMKAQARAMKMQARLQRSQMRLQRRMLPRRRSILGPMLILSLGVILLLAAIGRISWGASLDWYSRWWPAVLILAGLVLLGEWWLDQQRPVEQGQTRSLGGGVVFLLILLAITGITARGVEYGMQWSDRTLGTGYSSLNHLLGDRYDADNTLTQAITPGSNLTVQNPHGDITITGDSTDGQVHVSLHTTAYAWKSADAEQKSDRMTPTFDQQDKSLRMTVANVEGGQADLVVQVPSSTGLTIVSNSGDVNVTGVNAPVTATANHGDVELGSIQGAVNLHVSDDDAILTLHNITGPVVVEGHGGDAEITDIHGDLSMQGDFFGSTSLSRIAGAVRFASTRTQFSAARLDDDFSISRDSLDASQLVGPVVLKTTDKNITLDRVSGTVSIANRNGAVSVTHVTPMDAVDIQDAHGSIDVGVPEDASFNINAEAHNGDLESDFKLPILGSDNHHSTSGKIGSGGPLVHMTSSDGDITIRRVSVSDLPPAPPAPPTPPSPPSPPDAAHAVPKPPAAPKAPHLPKKPVVQDF
jgi:DUF4097 and DUF4098 domain-containing protein YvlB